MELCRRVTAQSKSVDVVGGWCRASVVQLYRRAGAALQQIYKPVIGDSTSSAQWSKSGRGATAPCIQLEADDRRCCYLAILHVHLIQTLIGGAGGCTRERSRFQCQRGLVDGQLAEAWTLGGMRGRRTSAPTRGEIAVYSLQPPTCTTNGWLSSLSLSLSLRARSAGHRSSAVRGSSRSVMSQRRSSSRNVMQFGDASRSYRSRLHGRFPISSLGYQVSQLLIHSLKMRASPHLGWLGSRSRP